MMNAQGDGIDSLSRGSCDARAIPRRFYWLKRIVAAYVVFLVGVVLLSRTAGRLVEGRLLAEMERVRGRGEPVLIEDFAEGDVADEENAAFFLQRAAESFKGMSDEAINDFNGMPTMLPLSPAQVALMEKLTERYAQSLQDVRAARARKGVKWGMQLKSPAITVLLPWLSPQRSLVQFVRSAALHAHQQGNDGAAVEYVRDLLAVARTVDGSPFLITHVIAMAIESEALGVTLNIIPDLRMGEGGTAAGANRKLAARQQVEALLAELAEERGVREGFVRCLQGERLFQIDTARCLADGRLGFGVVGNGLGSEPGHVARWMTRMVRPLVLNEARGMFAWSSQMVEAAREEDLAGYSAKVPAVPTHRMRQPLLGMLVPALNVAGTRHYSVVYQRRKAAIAVAERLYFVDRGRPAQRLEDLVPAYLPHMPTDPMKGGGTPMPFAPTTQPAAR